MAKQPKAEKTKSGPHLAAAFFCEMTLLDKDGAPSAIRLIDNIEMMIDPSAPPDFPSDKQKIPINLNGLLCFKTGDSPGDHTLRLVMHSPTGKSSVVMEKSIPFTPMPQGGINVRLSFTIMVKSGGLFWLHVYLDGKRYTRMPLHISIQRADAGSPTDNRLVVDNHCQ